MNVVLFVSLPVAGIVLGWIIRWLYAKFQLSSAEQKPMPQKTALYIRYLTE